MILLSWSVVLNLLIFLDIHFFVDPFENLKKALGLLTRIVYKHTHNYIYNFRSFMVPPRFIHNPQLRISAFNTRSSLMITIMSNRYA